jgi:hypothetical protein
MRMGALAASIAVLVAASDASAFCRTHTCRGVACEFDDDGCPISGKPLFWAGGCVGFSLEQSLSEKLPKAETRIAIQRAFQQWTEVECSATGRSTLKFVPMADATCRRSEYRKGEPNVNVIFFRDDDWRYTDIDNTLAKTTVTFNATTGEIYDADIEVNTAFNPVTVTDESPQYDLQSIMTHEVGHLIGLAHSPFPEASMFAGYAPGDVSFRTLANDDVAAICTVYPPERLASCDPTPRGGLDLACDQVDDKSGCAFGGRAGMTFGIAFSLLTIALARARRTLR